MSILVPLPSIHPWPLELFLKKSFRDLRDSTEGKAYSHFTQDWCEPCHHIWSLCNSMDHSWTEPWPYTSRFGPNSTQKTFTQINILGSRFKGLECMVCRFDLKHFMVPWTQLRANPTPSQESFPNTAVCLPETKHTKFKIYFLNQLAIIQQLNLASGYWTEYIHLRTFYHPQSSDNRH